MAGIDNAADKLRQKTPTRLCMEPPHLDANSGDLLHISSMFIRPHSNHNPLNRKGRARSSAQQEPALLDLGLFCCICCEQGWYESLGMREPLDRSVPPHELTRGAEQLLVRLIILN